MLVRINATEQLLAQLHVVERFYGLVPIGIDFLVLRTSMMMIRQIVENLTFTGTGASSRGSGGVSMAIMRLSPALLLAYAYSSSTSNAQSIFDRAPDLCHQSCGRTSKYAYRAPTQDKSFTHSGWPASSGSTRHGTSSGGWMGVGWGVFPEEIVAAGGGWRLMYL